MVFGSRSSLLAVVAVTAAGNAEPWPSARWSRVIEVPPFALNVLQVGGVINLRLSPFLYGQLASAILKEVGGRNAEG